LYRGHPDHFTTYTSYLYLTTHKSHFSACPYNLLALFKLDFGRADPELLISNPCTVNLKSPKTISNVIRRDLEDILIQVTKNRDLAMIFSDKVKARDKEFFFYLAKTRPYHPRVLHETLRNNLQGAKLAYTKGALKAMPLIYFHGNYKIQSAQ
jgi:hypothetical protein